MRTTPKLVHKKWGYEEIFINTDLYCGKLLHLEKGHQCSIHYHKVKDETFYLISGEVFLELFDECDTITPKEVLHMYPGMSVRILPMDAHRFKGVAEESIILEVSTTDRVEDSVRLTQSGKVTE